MGLDWDGLGSLSEAIVWAQLYGANKTPCTFLTFIMAQLFKWHDLNTYIQLVDCRVCLMKIQFVDSHFFQVWGVGSKLERRGGCSYEASVQPASALQKPNLSLDKRIAGEPLWSIWFLYISISATSIHFVETKFVFGQKNSWEARFVFGLENSPLKHLDSTWVAPLYKHQLLLGSSFEAFERHLSGSSIKHQCNQHPLCRSQICIKTKE